MNKKFLYILSAILMTFLLSFSSAIADQNIIIKGSTTVLPISQKIAETYMKENPNIKISLSGGGSGEGIKALIDNITNIANSSRFIKNEEIKLAIGKGIYPVPFKIAHDCIVPIVHSDNPIKNITIAQLKAIYKGNIKNWKELGGKDQKIAAISRDTSSGTYEVWEEKIMNKERVYPGALLQASNGMILQTVSKNKNAIGYVGVGYLNKNVKGLQVNSIEGSIKTTLNGTYPISRPLFIFTAGWPQGDVMNFINYTLNPEKGQKLIKEMGFVPIY